MITVDGYKWDVPCDIDRQAEITPSDISGLMLDRSYFNDVLGTYMSYDVTLAVPPSMTPEYAALYETLTDPVESHRFVLPHTQGNVEIVGRVQSVSDVLVYTASKKQYWRGIRFSIASNHPIKRMSLGEIIGRGRREAPTTDIVPVGTLYIMTEYGWAEADYANADEIRY